MLSLDLKVERERERERESQFNTAGGSKFQVRGAAVLKDRLAKMSVEMARTAVGRTTIECCVRWCATRCAGWPLIIFFVIFCTNRRLFAVKVGHLEFPGQWSRCVEQSAGCATVTGHVTGLISK